MYPRNRRGGFLGSHLCEQLLQAVLCLDNFFPGNKRNIVHLHDHPLFELIRHDVTLPIYLEAGRISPWHGKSWAGPGTQLDARLEKTVAYFERLLQSGIART